MQIDTTNISGIDINESLIDQSYYELASFHDMIYSYTSGAGLNDISLKDLYGWLRNPKKHRKKLISLSKYYYAKDGIVTDIYDTFKTLPILNYSVSYQNMKMKKFPQVKNQVDKFLDKIKLKRLIRDTIFQIVNEGSCVWYNRNNKYIQFLAYDEVRIEYMVDGNWQVEYDLEYIDKKRISVDGLNSVQNLIKSAPSEVTINAYNAYKKDINKRYVPLDISKTKVFKLRGGRNEPCGMPYCVPALASIIHGDLLERTEKALADRIINQIIIQKLGTIKGKDGKSDMPLPKTAADGYHNNLKKLLQKKYDTASTENSSIAPLTIPSFVDVEELKVNMNTFPKEIWERVDRNIYQKLGFSQTLNAGGGNGQSYGSGTINVEKIFSIIFYIIEDIESAINEYLDDLISSPSFNPKVWISRATILDKDTAFKQAEGLYLKGRGSLKYFVEAAGYSFDHYLSQVEYENEILDLDSRLPVHSTSFTSNGDNESGRPSKDGKNENTDNSQGNNGNKNPDIS